MKALKRNCPFNYAGSKSNYSELFNIDEPIVDLFGGGGGFWSNTKSTDIVVNDINADIIKFQAMLYLLNREEFDNLIVKMENITDKINSREEYEELRRLFNQTKDPILFYCLLSTCTNNLIRYNLKGGFNQTWGQRKFNSSMRQKLEEFYTKIKAKKIVFISSTFNAIPAMNNRIYFADPPYLITNAGYNTAWGEENEKLLYTYLSDKRFILTNYIKKGNITNKFLETFIKDKPNTIIRSGKMKSQKNDEEFIEIVAFSDTELMDKVIKTNTQLF